MFSEFYFYFEGSPGAIYLVINGVEIMVQKRHFCAEILLQQMHHCEVIMLQQMPQMHELQIWCLPQAHHGR